MILIDLEALPNIYMATHQELIMALEATPEVDAVPVIRCKDCKYHYYHEMLKQHYCEIPNMQFGEIEPNGYCHRAERKEE